MNYTLPVTCGNCGADVESLAQTTSTGASTNAVCRCLECKAEWLIAVQMSRLPSAESQRRQRYARSSGAARVSEPVEPVQTQLVFA